LLKAGRRMDGLRPSPPRLAGVVVACSCVPRARSTALVRAPPSRVGGHARSGAEGRHARRVLAAPPLGWCRRGRHRLECFAQCGRREGSCGAGRGGEPYRKLTVGRCRAEGGSRSEWVAAESTVGRARCHGRSESCRDPAGATTTGACLHIARVGGADASWVARIRAGRHGAMTTMAAIHTKCFDSSRGGKKRTQR
jgi:hypothetical protein